MLRLHTLLDVYVQRSWENLVPKDAPARLRNANVTTVVASRKNCRNKRDNLSTIRNKEGTMQTFFSTANGCGTSLKPPPPAAAARPLATATPPASVTNDAARSRASTGAPTLPLDDAVAPLPGVNASDEPANLAGVDESQPPPDPPANTERTRSVHDFEDLTDEEDAPAAGDVPDDPTDDEADDDDDDVDDDADAAAAAAVDEDKDCYDY
jgi:hypothetical protein